MSQQDLLKIDINQLAIMNPNMRAIPVYRKVIDRVLRVEGDFDGRKKRQNVKEMAYIHLSTHFQLQEGVINPYWRYGEDKYKKLVEDLGMPEGWKVDEDLQAAIDLYTERVVITDDMEMLDAAEHAARQTTKYLKGVDYDKRDTRGNFLYTPDKVMATIAKVRTTIEELVKSREQVQNNIKQATNKVRGGGEVGNREVPKR